jgi:hypothetical protein
MIGPFLMVWTQTLRGMFQSRADFGSQEGQQ